MVVEGKNSGNHEGKNRTVEGNKNMKNGTIYTPDSFIDLLEISHTLYLNKKIV